MDSSLRWIVRAAVLIALARPALAETESQTQTVIRGTGSDVTIVYRSSATPRLHGQPIARPRPQLEPPAELAAPLTEAAQMKSRGASDESIIAYLRIHETELPPVVSTEDVDQLRKAGISRPVLASLSTLTAVEIGETGEGSAVMVAMPYGPPADMGWAGGGYPGGGYYGGFYGSGAFVGWGGRGRFNPHGHAFFPGVKVPGHFPGPMPVRSAHLTMSRSMAAHAGGGGTRTR